jgi:hypothetical protein
LADNGGTMIFPREHLVAALHARGICYLAPSPQGDEPPMTDEDVIIGLAASRDGRLRFALAALLIVHPVLAGVAARLVETRSGASALRPPEWAWDEIRRQYVAAMYLQRMWRTRLSLCLGERPLIPERFSVELGLPAADTMYGEMGLRTLTDRSPFNDWSSYEQVIDLLCEQPCRTPEAVTVSQ